GNIEIAAPGMEGFDHAISLFAQNAGEQHPAAALWLTAEIFSQRDQRAGEDVGENTVGLTARGGGKMLGQKNRKTFGIQRVLAAVLRGRLQGLRVEVDTIGLFGAEQQSRNSKNSRTTAVVDHGLVFRWIRIQPAQAKGS